MTKPVYERQVRAGQEAGGGRAFRFFDALSPSAEAPTATAYEGEGDLDAALQAVLSLLREAGHERVYRVDLRCPAPEFAVVKILAPSLRWSPALF